MPVVADKLALADSGPRDIIALRKGFIMVPDGNEQSADVAVTLQAELMHLGFAMDTTAFSAAMTAPRDWLIAFHDTALSFLRKQLGADRAYAPFYRNFPRQVMDASTLELFVNAILHYFSGGRWEPTQALEERGIRFENTEFTRLRYGNENDLMAVFSALVESPQSLTPDDQGIVAWFCQAYGDTLPLPDVIPFKETLCLLASAGLPVPVERATDVLRIAVSLSGGDISLPAVPRKSRRLSVHPKLSSGRTPPALEQALRFQSLQPWREERSLANKAERNTFEIKHFGMAERRYLLGLLEKTTLDLPEMQMHLGRWLRLGEILHVGDTGQGHWYAHAYPRTLEAFRALRNQQTPQTRVRTFNSRVEAAFSANWTDGVDLLATRPGVFARKLDWMVRTFDPAYVLPAFYRVGPQISSKVLLELKSHFELRSNPDMPRSVMIKGKRSKHKTLDPLPPLSQELVERINALIMDVLRAKIAGLPPIPGTMWIDERLRDVPLPTAMRSMNTSVKTYVRGTRVPYRPAKVIRPFIHWYDEDGSEDLDLSVGFYTQDLAQVTHLSYTNLRAQTLNSCHSGDIRCRAGACAEYVDIDIQRCLASGVRFALVHVYNFNGRPMHTIPNTVFGLMEREYPQANEIFVPATLSNCMGLANESNGVYVCAIDLQESCYIWADIESKGRLIPAIESTWEDSVQVLKSLLHTTDGLSVYDLLRMHADARGQLVASPEEADLSLRWEDFVTNYASTTKYMAF